MAFKDFIAKFGKKKIVLMLVALLVVSATGIVAAKYVSNYQKEAVIHASNFHFSSNYLNTDENVPVFSVSDWGSNHITFYLYNYEVENMAQISDTDIRYKIEVDDGWNVSVEDAAGTVVEPNDNKEYTMKKNAATTHHKVTLIGEGGTGSVNVKVKSTHPYAKTLRAKFNLATKKSFEYTVEDKGNYAVVTISTNDFYGSISLTWNPETHSPDNTSLPQMAGWQDAFPTGTMPVLEYTTYTLIFVEKGNQDTKSNNFVITGA